MIMPASPPSHASIVVVGSLNLDLVMHVPRMPLEGETLRSTWSGSLCGGKGANQAVACARMGAPVAMIGRLGDDPAGLMLRSALAKESINLDSLIATPETASGAAVFLLTPDGQNRIIIVGGANALLTPDDISTHSGQFDSAGLLLCQLEVPLETVAAAIACAAARDIPALLNPAPALPLPPEILTRTKYLIPNESEATALTGILVDGPDMAARAAQALLQQGVGHVIVTLGAAGIMIADHQGCRHRPALPTNVIDTTAAGDSFIGGFATGIIEGLGIDDAAALGLGAAAICVSRAGAQVSLPYRSELKAP
jgi:ribokinase